MSNRNMKVAKVQNPRQNSRKSNVDRSKERDSNQQPGMVLYRKIPDQIRVIRVLRFFFPINANASGYVNLATYFTSQVSTNTEWNNQSQEWQQYRVRRMVMKLFPCHPTSAAASGANDYPLGLILATPWWETAPSIVSSLRQAPLLTLCDTGRHHTLTNNFLGMKEAQLWTSTANAIASDSIYGVAVASDTGLPALEASTNVFNCVLEYDVEFQGVQ